MGLLVLCSDPGVHFAPPASDVAFVGFPVSESSVCSSVMGHEVYISHAYPDRAIADAACAALEARGIRCWLATRDVANGEQYAAALIRAIRACRVMVLIFSSHANRSETFRHEVELASDRRIPVVPVRVENVWPDDKLMYHLSAVKWLDALTPPIDKPLEELAATVGDLLQVDASGLSLKETRERAWQAALAQDAATSGTSPNDSTPLTDSARHVRAAPAASNSADAGPLVSSRKIVISYRRQDSQSTTRAIFERLEREFGSDSVFMDVKIPVGIDFRRHIGDVLAGCNVLIAIIGPRWLGRRMFGKSRISEAEDWVRLEIETAMKRGVPVIPVLVDSASLPSKAELPPSISDLIYCNAARVDTGRDFSAHMADLIDGTRRVLRPAAAEASTLPRY